MRTIGMLFGLFGLVGASHAAIVTPTFVNVGVDTVNAQSTTVLRADLVGLGLTEIAAITINDSNSGTGGSAGAYSGFDVDALFLDIDGNHNTTGDQIYASSFSFTAGAIRPGGAPASNTSGALNGSIDNSTVDLAFATLNSIDAVFFGAGSISLGDGGSLTANFSPAAAIGASLYVFVGEVGTGLGEDITGLIEISDKPIDVPVPSAFSLILLGLLGLRTFYRRPASG